VLGLRPLSNIHVILMCLLLKMLLDDFFKATYSDSVRDKCCDGFVVKNVTYLFML